jgi:hypothetical protein
MPKLTLSSYLHVQNTMCNLVLTFKMCDLPSSADELNNLVQYAGNHVVLGWMLNDDPKAYFYLMQFVKSELENYHIDELLPPANTTITKSEVVRRRVELRKDWLGRIDHTPFKEYTVFQS